jgi:hypothetical protein
MLTAAKKQLTLFLFHSLVGICVLESSRELRECAQIRVIRKISDEAISWFVEAKE